MAVGNACVADPLDTVHLEKDSVVRWVTMLLSLCGHQ